MVEQQTRFIEVMKSISHCCGVEDMGVDDNTGETKVKKRKIYDSTIQKAKEMCESFKQFNLTGNAELEEARASLEVALAGVDAELIRDSDAVRANVKEDVDSILSKFGALPSTSRSGVLTPGSGASLSAVFAGVALGLARELDPLAAGEFRQLFVGEINAERAAFVVEKIRKDLGDVVRFVAGGDAPERRHSHCHVADVDRGLGRFDGDRVVASVRRAEGGGGEEEAGQQPARKHAG
jgi:hypothetical protein